MTGEVLLTMIQYLDNDIHQINHALKVFGYAKAIATAEGLAGDDLSVVECSAILHDIGIPESMKKYNSSSGKYQEEMGMLVGEKILKELSYPDVLMKRVLFIIGNHHSYGVDGGIVLQIIFEADFIVNLEEGNLGNANPLDIKNKNFKTDTGKKLMETIFKAADM